MENYLNSLVADITTAQNEGGVAEGSIEEESAEYEISPVTSTDDNWNFMGGFSITPSTAKDYSTGKISGTTFTGIKFSSKVVYTINLPEGVSIDGIDVTGYANVDEKDGYILSVNGKTFGAGDYVMPSRTDVTTVTHSILLDNKATGTLPVSFYEQAVAVFKLYSNMATGIKNVYNVDMRDAGNDAIYTLDGRRVNGDVGSLGKGIYIINRKKVVIK